MRKLMTILTAALISVGAVAGDVKTQDVKAPVSKEQMAKRRELAEKFLVTMKVEKQMTQVFQMIQQSQSKVLKNTLKDAVQVKKAEAFQARMMKIIKEEMSWAKMKLIFVDVYSSVYSVKELEALNQFFSSPVGQSFVDKTPEVNKVTMQKMSSIMISMANRVRQEAEKFKKEAIEKAKKAAKSDNDDKDSDDDQMMQ